MSGSATHRIVVEKNIRVPTRDGIQLATDVYRRDSSTPGAVLLQRTPYDKDSSSFHNFTLEITKLVEAGFVVVVQDVRGRFASQGSFEPMANDATDAADTVSWILDQEWADGRVGMFGASYYGANQWQAAGADERVRAIAPAVCSSDFHQGWVYQGGAFQLGFNLTWVLSVLEPGDIVRRLGHGDDAVGDLVALTQQINTLDEEFQKIPLPRAVERTSLSASYQAWLQHSEPGSYWGDRGAGPERSLASTPSLNIGGWYDIFLRGTIADYLAAVGGGGRSRLVIGPWAHGNMTGDFPERSFGFGSHYQAIDPTGLHLRWFDEHLRGIAPAEEEAPVRIFVMGSDEWRESWSWPLPGTEFRSFFLTSDGTAHDSGGLTTTSPKQQSSTHRELAYDPRDPVPTVGGATFLPGLLVSANAGPRDQSVLDARTDVLRYSTEPLEDDLEVIGPVELVLHVSSSAVDTDFTGKLIDVHPDGRSIILTDGILRARYRDGVGRAEDLAPDSTYELTVDLGATANVFRRGHRVRVDVSSSNFPKYDRNLNTGSATNEGEIVKSLVARNSVHIGPGTQSRLVLPVVSRPGVTW